MLKSRATFVFIVSIVSASGFVAARAAEKPKLSASAIQIAMVDAGDIQIPAEFRFAMYEQLVDRVRKSGAFQKVYRIGDHASDSVPDLVTLHTTVEGFKEGNQTVRELTTVLGGTRVDILASVTARDGHELMSQKITGRVRFFGENLGVTNDLAKRITKPVREAFVAGH
jgi:hypothetical protein